MGNIKKVIKREYLSRVKKKSFIIMTILAPLLIVGFYAALIGIGVYSANTKSDFKTAVLVNQSLYLKNLPDTIGELLITGSETNFDSAISKLRNKEVETVLTIGNQSVFETLELGYYSMESTDAGAKSAYKSYIYELVREEKAKKLQINQKQLDSLEVSLNIVSKQVEKEGMKENNETVKAIIGLMFTMLIYFFIFLFSVQVMRGVMEEKSNRIVEVLVSTVKPFDLMFGKITGIALVGLTQFLIWIALSSILLFIGNLVLAASFMDFNAITSNMASGANLPENMEGLDPSLLSMIGTVAVMPWPKIIFAFISFFVGGYLLYSSIFAAIGSAVDSETDTQQFMLPISLPLVFGIVIAQSAAFSNPNSDLAFWASMIPFTSPIVMTVRACFDVPWWEMLLSIGILYLTFFLMVKLVAKIYRIGILTFGNKPSWKQLFQWVFRKE